MGFELKPVYKHFSLQKSLQYTTKTILKMKKVFSLALLLAVMASCKKNKQDVTLYEVNSARSVAGWKGATPNHFHTGTFAIQGNINTRSDGSIKGGSFIIPIASIQNDDLPNPVR